MDSNGDIYISGGNLFISVNDNGGSCAIDYGSENGRTCEISGGTVMAVGSSFMAEGFDSSSAQCFIMYTTPTASAGTIVTLQNSVGTVLMSEAIPCSFSSVVISTPKLQMGETCTISIGDTEEDIIVDNSSNSGGFGMRGMFGGGMQQDGFPGGMRGGRSGRRNQFDGSQSDTSDPDIENVWPQDMPDMPGGDVGGMEMPTEQLPDGEGVPDMQSGDMPEIPDREISDQDAGQMQVPDQQHRQGGMDGDNRRDGDQPIQWGQNRDWMQDGETVKTSVVSSESLILTGVSILVLLAGILFALKVKY